MILTMILATAIGQAPAPAPSTLAPRPAAKAKAKVAAKAKADPAPAPAPTPYVSANARKRAKKAAAYTRRLNEDAAAAERDRLAAIEAQKQYERMLPFMLENQRQQLDRMSQAERNAALNRMAGAMERRSGYVYPGQMPTPPTQVPVNPLYSPLMTPP